jgi:hypothetical protein
MRMRKILPGEHQQLCDGLSMLTEILDAVGVAEFRKSRQAGEIYWDTAPGAQVDPRYLQEFCEDIEALFTQWTMQTGHTRGHQ